MNGSSITDLSGRVKAKKQVTMFSEGVVFLVGEELLLGLGK